MSESLTNRGRTRASIWIYVGVAILVVAGLAAVGSVGYFAGSGWFGYRQILYGDGQLYLLNLGDDLRHVSLDGGEAIAVPAGDARAVAQVGGDTRVVVTDSDGEVVERRQVFTDHSNALVKLSADGCLAVSDVGAYYGRGGDALEILETIGPDEREYVADTTNVIWPRQPFPPKFASDSGRALWIELVGCNLVDEPKFLRGYLAVRLRERLNDASESDQRE